MTGRIIVTGATGAMGSAAVRHLAAKGQPVIMACRNRTKAEAMRSAILKDYPEASIEIGAIDLSSMASVREFAQAIEPGSISALFNNAGTISHGWGLTGEGLEKTFAVNYFGPWLLTNLLAEKMAGCARVVNMVSLTCRFAKLTEDSLHPTEKDFSQLGTYALAKRALLSFSMELARRHPDIKVNVSDPGVVASNMIDLGHWYDPLADALFKPLCKKPEAGVAPALRALESDCGGQYFVGRGNRAIPGRYITPELDLSLWKATEDLLGK